MNENENNEDLEEDASLVNEDCYGKGWLFKIQPDNIKDIENLIHGPEAIEEWLLRDIEKYSN